jgi:hypothetical protein
MMSETLYSTLRFSPDSFCNSLRSSQALLFESDGTRVASPRIDLLFDEEVNGSRDVVGLVPIDPENPLEVLVRIVQLRKGIYRGERDFQFRLPKGLSEEEKEEELATTLYKVRIDEEKGYELATATYTTLPHRNYPNLFRDSLHSLQALEKHYLEPLSDPLSTESLPYAFLPNSILTMLPLPSENSKEVRRSDERSDELTGTMLAMRTAQA